MQVLVDEALVASWVKEGLPSDPTSVQNGTILNNSERWPLIMDPQLQGIVWIKEREAKNDLKVVRMEDDKKVLPHLPVAALLLSPTAEAGGDLATRKLSHLPFLTPSWWHSMLDAP